MQTRHIFVTIDGNAQDCIVKTYDNGVTMIDVYIQTIDQNNGRNITAIRICPSTIKSLYNILTEIENQNARPAQAEESQDHEDDLPL